MRRMQKVTGRTDDMMIIRGVNVFPSQIEELILKDERLSPHYVLEIGRLEHLDTLTVRVEIKPELVLASAMEVASCASDLKHHIKSLIGVTTKIEIVGEGEVPRSMGKAQRVIDKRHL